MEERRDTKLLQETIKATIREALVDFPTLPLNVPQTARLEQIEKSLDKMGIAIDKMTILIVGNGSPEHSIVYRLRTLEDAAAPKPGMKDLFYRAAASVLGSLIVAVILFFVAVSNHLVLTTP